MATKLHIDYDIWPELADDAHGSHDKHGIVMHETISPNIMRSLADIKGVSRYLDVEGYGIHGITDNDGHKAWCRQHGRAIFYHASSFGATHHGHANTNFMGIEQISDIPAKYKTRETRLAAWLDMPTELDASAQLIAAAARAHGFPIVDNPGDTDKPGVTTHYEVSTFNGVAGGHTDCWPSHLGGYFPKRLLIRLAKHYYDLGYHF